jgi:hypothetical protein
MHAQLFALLDPKLIVPVMRAVGRGFVLPNVYTYESPMEAGKAVQNPVLRKSTKITHLGGAHSA